jgi:hypothetical protein
VAAPLAAWLIAKETTGSARLAAQENRRYESRLDVNDEAMELAYRLQAMCIRSTEAFDNKSGVKLPSWVIDAEEVLLVAARLEVRGSPAAAALLAQTARAAGEFAGLWADLEPAAGRPSDEARKRIHAAKDVVIAKRVELGTVVRSDLGHD